MRARMTVVRGGGEGGGGRDRFFASFRSSLATEPKVSTLKEARVVHRSRGTPLVRSPFPPTPPLSLSLSLSPSLSAPGRNALLAGRLKSSFPSNAAEYLIIKYAPRFALTRAILKIHSRHVASTIIISQYRQITFTIYRLAILAKCRCRQAVANVETREWISAERQESRSLLRLNRTSHEAKRESA